MARLSLVQKRGRHMKVRYIPAGITLMAGAITSLICLMRNLDVMYSLEVLLVVLIVFLYIGIKTQKIIVNVMHEQKMQEEDMIRLAEFREAERLRKQLAGIDDTEETEDAEEDSDEEEKAAEE